MQKYKKTGGYTKAYIKFMREMYKRHNQSTYTDLRQVYVKPSQSKLYALENIKRYKAETTPRIISHNTSYFTVAYFTTEDDISYFCVDTGRNTYVILDTYL